MRLILLVTVIALFRAANLLADAGEAVLRFVDRAGRAGGRSDA